MGPGLYVESNVPQCEHRRSRSKREGGSPPIIDGGWSGLRLNGISVWYPAAPAPTLPSCVRPPNGLAHDQRLPFKPNSTHLHTGPQRLEAILGVREFTVEHGPGEPAQRPGQLGIPTLAA